MSSIISGNNPNGVDLTDPSQNPVTVVGTISLGTGTLFAALQGETTAAWTVINQGSILGGLGSGIDLLAGGTVTNTATGFIGGAYGIAIQGIAGTVVNAGIVNGGSGQAGILLTHGGSVTNQAGGQILSGGDGITAQANLGSVTNAGTIIAGTSDAAVDLLAGGSVTNAAGGSVAGNWGISIQGAATGSVLNNGTVTGGAQSGVFLTGGTVTNQAGGTITGNWGVADVDAAGTVIASGTIIGTNGTAVTLPSGFANLVVDNPGAVFTGIVDGGNTIGATTVSTLELAASAQQGTISDLGASFVDFGAITVDSGAQWSVGGTVASGTTIAFASGGGAALTLANPMLMQGAISGFSAGDTISLTGIAATGSLYANGVLTLAEASGAVSLNLAGNFAASGLVVTNGAGGVQISLPNTGLLGDLNVNQQLELIYVAYFNRAADGGGLSFWSGQNVQAQGSGQSAATALTNIANSFTPQPETIALYPFLGSNLNLNTPAGQAGLTTFITALYENLFDRSPDAQGQAYWLGQLTTGAVGLGAAALAIANGATGADAIEVLNKITVALDFTNRTAAAGLGETAPAPASFLTAARGVLSGVDGTSLNDASVTAGMNATTAYLTGATTSQTAMTAAVTGSADANVITIGGVGQLVDPGTGNHTIQFLTAASDDTLVLHAGGVDQVSGFDPATDTLDLGSLLSAANLTLKDDVASLGGYLTIADQGADAVVRFDPTGHGGGNAIAILQGLGGTVTSLDALVTQGAIRIT